MNHTSELSTVSLRRNSMTTIPAASKLPFNGLYEQIDEAYSRKTLKEDATLTVVVLTLNEGERLPRCLAAIPARYPVVVVDSISTDDTVAIARANGCTVVQNLWPGFAAQRNFALQLDDIKSEWVLFIDADEVYQTDFFDWFEQDVSDRLDFDIGLVASWLVYSGGVLKHAPGYPIYHPRLVRRGHVTFIPNHTGHGETVSAEARQLTINIPYCHYWYDGDLISWMTKHVKLAAQEAFFTRPTNAKLTKRARMSMLLRISGFRMPARFLYHYVIRSGWRDGRHGLEYSLLYTWFEITKALIRFAGGRPRFDT